MTTLAKVALGWGVKLAVSSVPDGGRLAVVGGTYSFSDSASPGYDGYSGGTQFRADSDAATDALVRWLSRKPSGACNLLVCDQSPGYEFGNQFQAGLTRLGHTFTSTGNISSWSGYEPLDYDAVCVKSSLTSFVYHGLTNSADKFDYVLSHGGSVLSCPAFIDNVWERYGIVANAWHNDHSGEASPYQRPFYCAAIGGSLYKLPRYTTIYLTTGTNTKGGTLTKYDCTYVGCGNGVVSLWEGTSS